MKKIQLLMPMAGEARRFNEKSAAPVIKPLLKVKDRFMYQWALASFQPVMELLDLSFIIQRKHATVFPSLPGKKIVIEGPTRGPVETILRAFDEFNSSSPIVVCDCDLFFVSQEFYRFLASPSPEAAAAVLTFASDQPQYSYVRVESEQVVKIKEKEVISNRAVCGAYYFRSKELLMKYAVEALEIFPAREVFLSDLVQRIIEDEHRVRAIACDQHVSLGTPAEVAANSGRLSSGDFS